MSPGFGNCVASCRRLLAPAASQGGRVCLASVSVRVHVPASVPCPVSGCHAQAVHVRLETRGPGRQKGFPLLLRLVSLVLQESTWWDSSATRESFSAELQDRDGQTGEQRLWEMLQGRLLLHGLLLRSLVGGLHAHGK